jgi:hypothetical protein
MRNAVSIADDEIAIGCIAFHQAMTSYLQQRRVDVDCNDMACELRDLEREPTIA